MERRIKIKHPSGWAGIAASAFDPAKHELYLDAPIPFDTAGTGGRTRPKSWYQDRAKELGIRGAHLMKAETLVQRIAEAEDGADS